VKNIGRGKNTPLLSSRTKQRIRNHDSITLEFNLHFQDNSLSFDDSKEKELNKRQIVIYKLICFLKNEKGMGYKRITHWLNRSGIKTHQGKKWSSTGSSVYSVIKRMKQREQRLDDMKFKTQSKISNFIIDSGRN
jgi:hypothetical protein